MKKQKANISSQAKRRLSHGRRMGKSICGILALFALMCYLCSTFHAQAVQGMELFCSLMEHSWMGIPVMAYIIGGVGLLGGVIALRTLRQVYDNARRVENFLKKVREEQWDKAKLVQAYKNESKELVGRMLAMRMGVLLGDKHEHEHLRYVVPSLSAMREISLRSELGRSGAAFVGVVVSILLILGIFATLMGVHSVLKVGSSTIEFANLATALLPSAIAVALTVALIILRAIYMRAVESLIADLDAACIALFVPLLCDTKEKELDLSALGNATPNLDSAPEWFVSVDEGENLSIQQPDVCVDEPLKKQLTALKHMDRTMPSPKQDADHDFSGLRTLISQQAQGDIGMRLALIAVSPKVNRTR